MRTDTVSKQSDIESSDSYNIVIIGAGNVGTHISRHFHAAGHHIRCIYSRTGRSAQQLAAELGVPGTASPEEVPSEADFYILCVPDRAIVPVAEQFRHCEGICLHTSGAQPLQLLSSGFRQYGVLYPLQTLSSNRILEPAKVPCLVEGSSPEVTSLISRLASTIYDRIEEVDSARRLVIHTAAVFANNFSNHMVHIARRLLEERELDPALLNPLLEETYEKIKSLGTEEGRTGPAVRGDQDTLNKHIELLKGHPEWEKLYTFISRDIQRSL